MEAIAAMRCSDGQPDGKAPVQMFYLLTTMQQCLVRYALESQMSNMCLRVKGVAILIILRVHAISSYCAYFINSWSSCLPDPWCILGDRKMYKEAIMFSNHPPIWNPCRFKHQLSFI